MLRAALTEPQEMDLYYLCLKFGLSSNPLRVTATRDHVPRTLQPTLQTYTDLAHTCAHLCLLILIPPYPGLRTPRAWHVPAGVQRQSRRQGGERNPLRGEEAEL